MVRNKTLLILSLFIFFSCGIDNDLGVRLYENDPVFLDSNDVVLMTSDSSLLDNKNLSVYSDTVFTQFMDSNFLSKKVIQEGDFYIKGDSLTTISEMSDQVASRQIENDSTGQAIISDSDRDSLKIAQLEVLEISTPKDTVLNTISSENNKSTDSIDASGSNQSLVNSVKSDSGNNIHNSTLIASSSNNVKSDSIKTNSVNLNKSDSTGNFNIPNNDFILDSSLVESSDFALNSKDPIDKTASETKPPLYQTINNYYYNNNGKEGQNDQKDDRLNSLEDRIDSLSLLIHQLMTLNQNGKQIDTVYTAVETNSAQKGALVKKELTYEFTVYFKLGSTTTELNREVIDSIKKVNNTYQISTVLISSHTDKSGSVSQNLILSTKRSENTKKQLILLGIDPKVLFTQNFGESYALSEMASERRIICKVIYTK